MLVWGYSTAGKFILEGARSFMETFIKYLAYKLNFRDQISMKTVATLIHRILSSFSWKIYNTGQAYIKNTWIYKPSFWKSIKVLRQYFSDHWKALNILKNLNIYLQLNIFWIYSEIKIGVALCRRHNALKIFWIKTTHQHKYAVALV